MNKRLLVQSVKAWRCITSTKDFRYFSSSSKQAKVESAASSKAKKSVLKDAKCMSNGATQPNAKATEKKQTTEPDIAQGKLTQAKQARKKTTEEGVKASKKKAEPKLKQDQDAKTATKRLPKKNTKAEGDTEVKETSGRRAVRKKMPTEALVEEGEILAVEVAKHSEVSSGEGASGKKESASAMQAEQEKQNEAENDKEFQGVDEELKEFLQLRKEQMAEKESLEGEVEEEEDEYDCEWDYREVRHLPDDVKALERRLKELAATAPQGDRRSAMVKLKLALELCKRDDAQRAVDLSNEALKVLGIGANDYSMEQGLCLSALGAGYRKLEQKERGLSYLRRALRYFDEKEEKGIEVVRERQFILNELALTYLSMGNVKQGMESLSESLELLEAFLELDDPLLGDGFQKAAAHLCEVSEWKEAKNQCDKAIKVHGRSSGYESDEVGEDRIIMARIYTALNQHEQAVEQFRIAKQIFSEDKDKVYLANMGIAHAQLALGSMSEAIATLEGTINSAPSNPPTLRGAAYLKLAKAFYLKDKHEQARQRLSEALEFYKHNLSSGCLQEIASQLHEVAALFDAMGDVSGSITTLKLAIAAYDCIPGGESMLINAKTDLGSQLISHGQTSAALGCYKEALALSESLNKVSPNLLTLTAIAHMTADNHDAAVPLLERAEASLAHHHQGANKESLVEPGFVKLPVYQNLARCYRSLGRFKDALKYQKLVVAELRMVGGETEEKRIHDAVRMVEELSEKVEEMSEKLITSVA